MQPTVMTLVAPCCSCCTTPTELMPRDDLAGGIAVCPKSGQLYRPDGTGYSATSLPEVTSERSYAPSVRIDLSRSTYA
jgi:hypothetical protein